MGRPDWVRDLAERRIRKLFEQAEGEFKDHPERSDRYMEIAHRISEKYNVTIPKELKRRICPGCHCYWKPGNTLKVRNDSNNSRVIYTCLKCGAQRTYGYSQEKKQKSTH